MLERVRCADTRRDTVHCVNARVATIDESFLRYREQFGRTDDNIILFFYWDYFIIFTKSVYT